MKILVVEDEAIVSLMAEMIIEDLGHEVVGPAADIAAGIALINDHVIDGAILDVNICGERVYPVADLLIERGIPFAFATGYGVSGLDERYRSYPIIAKPYNDGLIERLVASFQQSIAA